MTKEMWRQVLDTYSNEGLQTTFIETLGWLAPHKASIKVSVGEKVVKVKVLAQLAGAAVVEVDEPGKASTQWHRKVDSELKKHFSERLTRFSNSAGDSWYWPKKLASGAISYDRLETIHGKLPDFLAQRLAGLAFTAKEHSTPGLVSPNEVRNRIRGQFESTKVTSDFFKKFKEKHDFLKSEIRGLPDQQTASSYATLILNRLMFVYFLQKKEFLNNDSNYLKNCLNKVQALKGKDKFYSFYRDYLLELFFNRLDRSDGKVKDTAIAEILGDVPYVNGGAFSQSESERRFQIEIPDNAFVEIFDFFDSYVWHLDTRPTGVANEINPEVIGYIFEQYINFTASGKKENGAYYTREDVTGYMVGQTLLPRMLDELVDLGLDVKKTLKDAPYRFINSTWLHGFDESTKSWANVPNELARNWKLDPTEWSDLDEADANLESCLPDETWVEMFNRRERVENLVQRIERGEVGSVEDVITYSLNSQLLFSDFVDSISSFEVANSVWERVTNISVLDPTCGSGAFLFAALEVLEDAYGDIIDRLEGLGADSRVLEELARHPNRRYFLRKHASLRNLYGTDIMADAIETAKLRIFLSLASCLESRNQLEPLPDLDFNLRVGNLVVGFRDQDDVGRVDNGRIIVDNKISSLGTLLSQHLDRYNAFIDASSANTSDLAAAKRGLEKSYSGLRSAADDYYAECTGMGADEFESWSLRAKPFHWVIEFPSVFAKGGFDVVIGNPPYIQRSKMSDEEKSWIIGFSTSDFKDFYAVCYERSISLLNQQGRHAFIVMLSLSFGDTAKSLRKFIRSVGMSEWWSTYGRWPDGLFSGARVRNTILVLARGSHTFASRHAILTTKSKPWLINQLDYAATTRSPEAAPVRGGIAQVIAERIVFGKPSVREELPTSVYVRPTASYWFPVVLEATPTLSESLQVVDKIDPSISVVKGASNISPVVLGATLASKTAYLIWQSLGDDFHVNDRDYMNLVRHLADLEIGEEEVKLAQAILSGSRNAYFVSNNAGKGFLSVRWNKLRHLTDPFEKALLGKLGLGKEWRNLNIWYRQTMRSTRENMNSVNLSKETVSGLLGDSSL